MPITPNYNTKTFADVWNNAALFKTDCLAADITISLTADELSDLFYMLYSKFGNSPIANLDETQFKYKVYVTIYSYGSIWKKRKAVLNTLLNLSESDIINRGKSISNFAANPSEAPSTGSTGELSYVDSQSVVKQDGNKVAAYMDFLDSLDSESDKWFLSKFESCFSRFASKNISSVFCSLEEEDE